MNTVTPSRRLGQGVVIGAVLIVISIAALVASFQIDKDPGGGWGARIFPLAGSGALSIVGLLELRSGQIASVNAPTKVNPSIWALLILALGYVWLISKIGYLLSTGLVAPLALWVFGIRRPIALLLAALLCPAIYHLVFFELLGVFPPYGKWFDLLDILQGY
ncbi:tripartite tricarboxylate transporter TctB family protein [Gymnodinialimonas ulvae]|uniref:tripartite tricarboxylate transporter TctB family protein n=1 Tax=Gymnodinialimonas ulvae TaxID=3126504 RepID=UPI00309C559A